MYDVRSAPTAGLWGEASCPPLPDISLRLVTHNSAMSVLLAGPASPGRGVRARKIHERIKVSPNSTGGNLEISSLDKGAPNKKGNINIVRIVKKILISHISKLV